MAKILIIEDIEDNRTLMSQLVRTLGHDVTICQDGEDGISLINKHEYDLIITDILMPGKDGLEVLFHIRNNLSDERSRMPVLAVSGGGYSIDKKIVLDAAQFKANRVMKKPFNVSEFNENVQALLTAEK